MSLKIRPGNVRDLEGIRHVESLSFPYQYSKEYMLSLISGERADVVFVAEDDGEVVGYVIARSELSEGVLVGHIISLAVHPSYRGRGIGKALMEKAIARLREMGCKKVYLEVRVSNVPAINLYRKLGFVPVRIIPKYYRDGEDAFVLEKTL